MNNEERITELEIRYSHQEVFLQELNQIVIDQQKTIERLEKEILDLKRHANSDGGVSPTRTLRDDIPPHY
jgi:SlyX protein